MPGSTSGERGSLFLIPRTPLHHVSGYGPPPRQLPVPDEPGRGGELGSPHTGGADVGVHQLVGPEDATRPYVHTEIFPTFQLTIISSIILSLCPAKIPGELSNSGRASKRVAA